MITTPQKALNKVSAKLNELTTITSGQRFEFFNLSVQALLDYSKWKFAKKKHTLSVTTEAEYDLTSEISDWNPLWGVDIIYVDGDQIFPVDYEDKDLYTNTMKFCFTPDEKSIYFTKELTGSETIEIWYFQRHVDVDETSDTLNVPLPEATLKGITLYMKHLVHDAKRQRNDARNAILDFQEAMEELTMQSASKKAKHSSKAIRSPLQHVGTVRNYAKH